MKISLGGVTLLIAAIASAAAVAQPPLRVGFLEATAAKRGRVHHDAALRLRRVARRGVAAVAGPRRRLARSAAGCTPWKSATWCGSTKATARPRRCSTRPRARISSPTWTAEERCCLSGVAGRMLNDLAVESTPLRVLSTSSLAVVSGIRVIDKHRGHPAFAGLDIRRPIPLTSRGCNALADFYGTAGPHGELLANGGGAGERPLVEYRVGEGRVIFVGWRLADFTTTADAYRPNLERLFTNLLGYLSAENRNRARCIRAAGQVRLRAAVGRAVSLRRQTADTGRARGRIQDRRCALTGKPPKGYARCRLAPTR